MDYERELAEIERHLLTQDPDLAAELDTFGDLTKARPASDPPAPAAAPAPAVPPAPSVPPAPAVPAPAPRLRAARRRRRLLVAACVAVVLIVVALMSALGAGAATSRPDQRAPRPGHALQEQDPVPGVAGGA
jgi:hypothetical protein